MKYLLFLVTVIVLGAATTSSATVDVYEGTDKNGKSCGVSVTFDNDGAIGITDSFEKEPFGGMDREDYDKYPYWWQNGVKWYGDNVNDAKICGYKILEDSYSISVRKYTSGDGSKQYIQIDLTFNDSALTHYSLKTASGGMFTPEILVCGRLKAGSIDYQRECSKLKKI